MLFELSREEVYKAAVQVCGHLLNLHGNWRAYRKLFRGNADSQPILAEVASQLFWLLERDVRAAVFIAFRQFTDGPQSMGNANASFHGLLRAAAGEGYANEHSDLVDLVERIRANPAIKAHVNKYMAHLDLHLLAEKSSPPESVEILKIEDALSAAREFMNEYMNRFFNEPPLDYEEKSSIITEQVENMVAVLRRGLDVS